MATKLDQYGKLVDVEENPESYAPIAPHNIGLPSLKFWRPGVRQKDTDPKTGLETLPSSFDFWTKGTRNSSEDTMRRHIEALRAAKELGFKMPDEVYDAKYLAAIALQEGRPDFGANAFNINNDKAIEVYNKLAPRFGQEAATFAAAVYDKGETAKRIKKPFPMVWNGTGTVRDKKGRLAASGENYAARFPMFLKAVDQPKNAPLLGFIDQYLNAKEYTSPLTVTMEQDLDREYGKRRAEAFDTASKKLKDAPLRQLQYTFLGSEGLLGVPKEYDPVKMQEAVVAPDLEKMKKYATPEYKSGGSIENTTHDRKII
jgi:hypothetical protein